MPLPTRLTVNDILILGEGGGDDLVGVDGDGLWVGAAGQVAAPAGEGPAGGGRSGERHDRATAIGGLIRIPGHRAAAHEVDGQRILILGEGGGDDLVGVDGDGLWVGAAGQVAAPAGEAPAGGGRSGERHDRATAIGGLIRIPGHRAAAHEVDGQRILILGEGGGDDLVGVDGDGLWVGAAGQVAAPAGEGPAGGRRSGERHDRATAIGGLIRIPGHRAAAHEVDGQRILILGEGGGDDLVGVDGDGLRVGAAGQVAAPAGEGPAGGGRSGERHDRATAIGGLIRIPGHRAAAHEVDGQRILILGEGGGDDLVGVDGDGLRVGAAGQVAAPAGEASSRRQA